jgi:hypothetical protein
MKRFFVDDGELIAVVKTHRSMPPRWIRLDDDGVEEIARQLQAASNTISHSPEWVWFAGKVWDYRESCQRTSIFQTWRSFARRGLLWAVEKLS